jgi:hypothetical protein
MSETIASYSGEGEEESFVSLEPFVEDVVDLSDEVEVSARTSVVSSDVDDEVNLPSEPPAPMWMLDYILSHEHLLKKNKDHFPKRTFLVYRCNGTCGGAGDRIKGMLHVFYTAMRTNRTFLIDYHSDNIPLNSVLQENFVSWNWRPVGGLENIDSTEINHIMNRDDLFNLVEGRRESVIYAKSNMFNPPLIWHSEAMRRYLEPYNIRLNESFPQEIYSWAFNSLFKKSKIVKDAMDEIKSRDFNFKTPSEAYVGVHVRIGGNDNRTDFPDPERPERQHLDLFLNCAYRMQNFTKNLVSKPVKIVVFSDSREVKEAMKSREPSIRSADTKILHVDKTEWTAGISSADEIFLGHIHAWSEFFLLSESTCIVASRSGFSELAAQISVETKIPGSGRCASYFSQCNEFSDEEILHFDTSIMVA